MAKKVKFGIIGTGGIARIHAQALKDAANAELVAVFDTVPERAKSFAAEHGVRAASNFDEFLADPEVEAVTIATPTGIHGTVAIPAARAGKHILCEKPLDVTVEKTDAIIAECRKHGVILSAVFQSRFGESIKIIKRAVDAGRFGRIVLASTQCKWSRSQEYYDSATWRGTWALDGGGALMNQSIHSVDLLLYLNGDVEEVTAHTATLTHTGIEVEDTAAAVLKFKNGSLGVIEASTSCAPGFPRRVELSGDQGSVILDDARITRWQFVHEEPGDEEIRKSGSVEHSLSGNGASDPLAIKSAGHQLQIEALADAILKGEKSVALSGEEGRRAVALICAIYESARTGKTVRL